MSQQEQPPNESPGAPVVGEAAVSAAQTDASPVAVESPETGATGEGVPLTAEPTPPAEPAPLAEPPCEPVASAPESAPVSELGAQPPALPEERSQLAEALCQEIREVRTEIRAVDARLKGLEGAINDIAKQLAYIPPQVRLIAGKVDDVGVSISDSRYRALLLGLLGVYDLVDQSLRAAAAAGKAANEGEARGYEVLRTQLRQLLETNGLQEIPAQGAFDPAIHRAVQSVPCEDAACAGGIKEVLRPGFRTASSVLRYAEVVVWKDLPEPPA
jgi:molecular chaperone GrpE (heat shock protein)